MYITIVHYDCAHLLHHTTEVQITYVMLHLYCLYMTAHTQYLLHQLMYIFDDVAYCLGKNKDSESEAESVKPLQNG